MKIITRCFISYDSKIIMYHYIRTMSYCFISHDLNNNVSLYENRNLFFY